MEKDSNAPTEAQNPSSETWGAVARGGVEPPTVRFQHAVRARSLVALTSGFVLSSCLAFVRVTHVSLSPSAWSAAPCRLVAVPEPWSSTVAAPCEGKL
jgi:hypothetical protein